MSQEDKEISFMDSEEMHEFAVQDWFMKHYALLMGQYVDNNHDDFMEYVTEMYEDRQGGDFP